MRGPRFWIGIAVVVLGTGIFATGVYVLQTPTVATSTTTAAVELSPQTLGSLELSLRWSGMPNRTTVDLTTTEPQCLSTSGIVAHGTGSSGTLTASLHVGWTYYLFACAAAGHLTPAQFRYTAFGFTHLMLAGSLVAALGAVVLLLSIRGRPSLPTPPPIR